MSAFGQAGFGSMNRRNQLRAQGQMDPYGQQVRAAKQAPTLNIYQTQQPAQQPASQQAKPPASAAAPAMQAYSQGYPQPAAPVFQRSTTDPNRSRMVTGNAAIDKQNEDAFAEAESLGRWNAYTQGQSQPSIATRSAASRPGTAQPIQPQSTGTPYSAPPKQDWLQSMSDDELKKSLSSWTAAGTSGTGGAFVDANLKAATAELARRGQSFDATGARRQQLQGDVDRVNRQISDWNDRAQPGQPRIGETFLVNGQPDQQWMQANQYWADQRRQAQTALDAYNSENPVIQTGGPGRMRNPEAGPSNAYWDNGVLIQTGGPGRMRTPEAGPSAGYWDRDTWIQTGGPGRASPGAAQPIQPQSQSTPYGADPGYADRVAAAEQQWSSTPAGSQQIGNWQNNPSSVARERQQERATREAEMAAQGRASEALGQQANASERLYVQTGFGQRQFQRGDENVTEMAPSYGIAGLGQSHLPRYRQLADGTMQRVDQADRAPIGGWGPPGRAQPIQPQSQGTTYQSQPMVNDRPMRSIEDDMAADREYERQNGWWALEASRRGVDPATGAPLANRSDKQAAYHSAAYAPFSNF